MPRLRLMAAVIEKQRRPALFAGGRADCAADADRAIDLAHGNLALGHLAQQFEDEERALLVLVERAAEGLGEAKLDDSWSGARWRRRCDNAVRRTAPAGARNGLHVEGQLLAGVLAFGCFGLAEDHDLKRLVLGVGQHFDQCGDVRNGLAIDA